MNLTNTLAPLTARTIEQFAAGVTAHFRQRAPGREADGASARAWQDVPGMEEAPILLEELAAERALRAWGADKTVHLQATVAIPAGVAIDPNNFALKLVGGDRDGSCWMGVGARYDSTTRSASLALQATRDSLGLG
jgi:hypothetical protein